MGGRCIALIVDEFVCVGITCVSTCGCLYDGVKDAIREGQSIGKKSMNLRVIDYNSGAPASFEQSVIRNCLCVCGDVCTCYVVAFLNSNGRRIGDHVAGTIVIRD